MADASFMDGVLKNYLEAYLIDTNRTFKLVYDFTVSKGFLSKLFSGNLDAAAKAFWKEKIHEIKRQTLSWKWDHFDFDDFISKLSFENVKKATLEQEIENALISNWGIMKGNIDSFHSQYNKLLTAPLSYPREHRPFEEKLALPEQFRKAKGSYFDGIQNYSNQLIQFVKHEKNSDNLALYNLRTSLAALANMQGGFYRQTPHCIEGDW